MRNQILKNEGFPKDRKFFQEEVGWWICDLLPRF